MFLGDGAFYNQDALKIYGEVKKLKKLPNEVLKLVDAEIARAKIYADLAIGELQSRKDVKALKYYNRLRKLRGSIESAIGFKSWKFFEQLSAWKKASKLGTLKLLRKSLGTAKGALKETKLFKMFSKWKGIGKSTLKSLKGSLTSTKLGGFLAKTAGVKIGGKAVGKILRQLFK